jgi:hypothetical protein
MNNPVFNVGRKMKAYQHNYLEHILILPTNGIPRKYFEYYPKGKMESELEGSVGLTQKSKQLKRPKP